MKLKHYIIIAVVLIAGIVLIVINYPNLYLSGEQLFDKGKAVYKEGDQTYSYDLDDMRDAASYFQKAIDKGYHDKLVYEYLIKTYHNLSQVHDEENVYTQALAAYPNDPVFLWARAAVREKLGNVKGAYSDYNTIINTSPRFKGLANAYYNRGAIRFLMQDTVDAKLDREKANQLTGTQWPLYRVGQPKGQSIPM